MPTLVYTLALAFFFTHEMDAVPAEEWRLLYGLRDLPEPTAYPVFLLVHIPLFFLILWLGQHGNARLRECFRLALAGFLAVHAGLHARLSDHPHYGFEGLVSHLPIYGAGLLGAVYLLLWYLARKRPQGGAFPL